MFDDQHFALLSRQTMYAAGCGCVCLCFDDQHSLPTYTHILSICQLIMIERNLKELFCLIGQSDCQCTVLFDKINYKIARTIRLNNTFVSSPLHCECIDSFKSNCCTKLKMRSFAIVFAYLIIGCKFDDSTAKFPNEFTVRNFPGWTDGFSTDREIANGNENYDAGFDPEKDMFFQLYTQRDFVTPQILLPTNWTTIETSDFNASIPTRIFIHGWRGHPRFSKILADGESIDE